MADSYLVSDTASSTQVLVRRERLRNSSVDTRGEMPSQAKDRLERQVVLTNRIRIAVKRGNFALTAPHTVIRLLEIVRVQRRELEPIELVAGEKWDGRTKAAPTSSSETKT